MQFGSCQVILSYWCENDGHEPQVPCCALVSLVQAIGLDMECHMLRKVQFTDESASGALTAPAAGAELSVQMPLVGTHQPAAQHQKGHRSVLLGELKQWAVCMSWLTRPAWRSGGLTECGVAV